MRLLALLILLAAPAAASAESRRIVANDHGIVTRIGPWTPKTDNSLAKAIEVFGEPDRAKEIDPSVCAVTFGDLKVFFANFGGIPKGESVCDPENGFGQTFKYTGVILTSSKGLKVGMSEKAIARRHPDAEQHARSWWLTVFTYPFGTDEPAPVIRATVRQGKVASLQGYIGGAGE